MEIELEYDRVAGGAGEALEYIEHSLGEVNRIKFPAAFYFF